MTSSAARVVTAFFTSPAKVMPLRSGRSADHAGGAGLNGPGGGGADTGAAGDEALAANGYMRRGGRSAPTLLPGNGGDGETPVQGMPSALWNTITRSNRVADLG